LVTSKLPLLRDTKEKTDELIREKQHVTVMTMVTETGTGHNVIHEMENFAYKKVCTQCFPHLQMEEHKHQQKNVFSRLGEQYAVKSNDFHQSIVMGDNSWFH
jgi:hypothetical protein